MSRPSIDGPRAFLSSFLLRRTWRHVVLGARRFLELEARLDSTDDLRGHFGERESAGRCGARVACFLFFSFLSETRVKKEKRFELESGRRRKKSKRALACLLRRF
jgi:hypothetical protein